MVVVFPDHTHLLFLFITNGIISSKIYDKRDDFKFETVNYPFLDGDVPVDQLGFFFSSDSLCIESPFHYFITVC